MSTSIFLHPERGSLELPAHAQLVQAAPHFFNVTENGPAVDSPNDVRAGRVELGVDLGRRGIRFDDKVLIAVLRPAQQEIVSIRRRARRDPHLKQWPGQCAFQSLKRQR
jgi:hypothetical protein